MEREKVLEKEKLGTSSAAYEDLLEYFRPQNEENERQQKLKEEKKEKEELNKIRNTAEGIVGYLSLIFPHHTQKSYMNEAIYIKALNRTSNGTKGARGINLFNLDDAAIDRVEEYLLQHRDKKLCLTYAPFTYDHNLELEHKRYKRNGEMYMHYGKPYQIFNESTVGTSSITLDFDLYTSEEFEKVCEYLYSFGLEFIIVNSGHGKQITILLDGFYKDKTIVSNFVDALTKSNVLVDSQCKDTAHTFRLPFTMNNKCFDRVRFGHLSIPNPVVIEKLSEKRFSRISIEEITLEILDTPFMGVQKEKKKTKMSVTEGVRETASTEKDNAPAERKAEKQIDFSSIQIKTEEEFAEAYTHFQYSDVPEQIKNILMGVPDGIRNDAMLFLVPFFKNYHNLRLDETIETMQIWGSYCDPALLPEFVESEVERLWKYKFDALYGKYTPELEEFFGKMRFSDKIELDDQVTIDNVLFEKIPDFERSATLIYLTIKLLEKETGRYSFSREEIMGRADIAASTFKKSMKSLVDTKAINKHKNKYKKENEGYTYSINTMYTTNTFTIVPTATIELFIIKKMSKYEVAFYLLLRWQLWSNTNKELFIKRATLAEILGCDESTISKISDKLHKHRFIIKQSFKEGIRTKAIYKIIK